MPSTCISAKSLRPGLRSRTELPGYDAAAPVCLAPAGRRFWSRRPEGEGLCISTTRVRATRSGSSICDRVTARSVGGGIFVIEDGGYRRPDSGCRLDGSV